MLVNDETAPRIKTFSLFCHEELAMDLNVGTFDRIVRVILGLLLIAVALGYVPGYQTVWAWIGVIPLLTGIFGTCPVYSVLGINTRKTT
jgi:Protein of unknown function (DUF2892)